MKIVAVRKDSYGVITDVRLEDGKEYSIDDAVNMVHRGEISGVVIGHSKFGDPYLRGVGDGNINNNLDELPLF